MYKMGHQQGTTVQDREFAQSRVAAWIGGELGGEQQHVYVWLSHLALSLKLSQPC